MYPAFTELVVRIPLKADKKTENAAPIHMAPSPGLVSWSIGVYSHHIHIRTVFIHLIYLLFSFLQLYCRLYYTCIFFSGLYTCVAIL